nr:large subunit ribosomal protein L24 [uncultured archaeon]
MAQFSKSWRKSIQPRKQRKYTYNAPLHLMHKFMGSHLSAELRKKYGKRSLPLRKGDTVKVMRGKFKGKTGKVDRINLKMRKVYVQGIDLEKKDGSKVFYPLHPSKLMITTLEIDDKKRKAKLMQK